MCEYDPQKADETLVMFAHYLRSNINIMEEDEAGSLYKFTGTSGEICLS